MGAPLLSYKGLEHTQRQFCLITKQTEGNSRKGGGVTQRHWEHGFHYDMTNTHFDDDGSKSKNRFYFGLRVKVVRVKRTLQNAIVFEPWNKEKGRWHLHMKLTHFSSTMCCVFSFHDNISSVDMSQGLSLLCPRCFCLFSWLSWWCVIRGSRVQD